MAGGVVPSELTVKMTETKSAMIGTDKRPIRCQALSGEIGRFVQCEIYDRRPTACRNFLAVWEGNVANALCDQARATYGMIPIANF